MPDSLMEGLAVIGAVLGSISSDDRNDVDGKSSLVLVVVRKWSKRLFWAAPGIPFKSRICASVS